MSSSTVDLQFKISMGSKSFQQESVDLSKQCGSNNDPYGEHDFGSIKLEGTTFFWKIDYFDLAMSQHSVDPANNDATVRVLTVMCADEY